MSLVYLSVGSMVELKARRWVLRLVDYWVDLMADKLALMWVVYLVGYLGLT